MTFVIEAIQAKRQHLKSRRVAFAFYFEIVNTASQIKHTEADPDLIRLRNRPRFKEMIASTKERLGIKNVL